MNRMMPRLAVLLGLALLIPACRDDDDSPTYEHLLSGEYHHADFSCYGPTPDFLTEIGLATYNGTGGLSTLFTWNQNGTITPGVAGAGGYAVGSDRSLAIGGPGSLDYRGGILSGSGFVSFSGYKAAADPSLHVQVKKTGTFADADWTGTYYMVSIQHDVAGTTTIASTGTITSDGAGNLGISTMDNADGAVTGPNADTAAYAIAVDGTVTITTSGGDTLQGGIREGGDVVIAGAISAGADPTLLVAIRQSGTFTDATATGPYWIMTIAHELSAVARYQSVTGTMTADGAGNYNADIIVLDNTVGPVSTTDSGTYSIAPNGDITVTNGSGTVLNGGVLDGGSIILLAPTSAGSNPEIAVLIRK